MLEPSPDLLSGKSAARTLLAVRLSWRDEDESKRGLTPADLAREVILEHGGRIATSSPEAILAEMGSPTDTLQCAAALQDRFALERANLGSIVYVRTAVAVGEVVREGRSLIGEAVDHANRLAERASSGEVLFTQGVCLAMTRSEVTWELYTGPDPGIGQLVHRLLPQPGVATADLPFGGMGLRRGRGFFGTAARAPGELASAGLSGLRRSASLLAQAPTLLRANLAPTLTVLLLAALAAAAGVVILPARQAPVIAAALAEGRLDEARRLVDGWVAKAPRHPEARAWRGRVLAESDRLDEAHEILRAALDESPRLANASGIALGIVRTLDRKDADRSLVIKHPTAAVERALFDSTRSERYWLRWNSVRALEKLGHGDRIDRVEVFSLDLLHAGSCGTRVRAAQQLGKLGDSRAVPALEDARANGFPGGACNLKRAAGEALAMLGAPRTDG